MTNPEFVGPLELSTISNCRTQVPNRPSMDCSGFSYSSSVYPTARVQFAPNQQGAPLVGLAAASKPATWAELIVGFGLIGGVARWRQIPVAA